MTAPVYDARRKWKASPTLTPRPAPRPVCDCGQVMSWSVKADGYRCPECKR